MKCAGVCDTVKRRIIYADPTAIKFQAAAQVVKKIAKWAASLRPASKMAADKNGLYKNRLEIVMLQASLTE